MYDAKHVVVKQKIPDTKKITVNTALGENLKDNVKGAIEKTIGIVKNEKLEVVYIYNDTFDVGFDIVNNVIVGLTNFRIFKIEKGDVSYQKLNETINVEHEKNGIFRWDKVVCNLSGGKKETFGIYHADVCKYFCNYITNKIKKRNFAGSGFDENNMN